MFLWASLMGKQDKTLSHESASLEAWFLNISKAGAKGSRGLEKSTILEDFKKLQESFRKNSVRMTQILSV